MNICILVIVKVCIIEVKFLIRALLILGIYRFLNRLVFLMPKIFVIIDNLFDIVGNHLTNTNVFIIKSRYLRVKRFAFLNIKSWFFKSALSDREKMVRGFLINILMSYLFILFWFASSLFSESFLIYALPSFFLYNFIFFQRIVSWFGYR